MHNSSSLTVVIVRPHKKEKNGSLTKQKGKQHISFQKLWFVLRRDRHMMEGKSRIILTSENYTTIIAPTGFKS